MSNHRRKDYLSLARLLAAIMCVIFFNTATVISSAAQAADNAPPGDNATNCLLNRAQTF